MRKGNYRMAMTEKKKRPYYINVNIRDSLKNIIETVEASTIIYYLFSNKGNVLKTCKELQMNRQTFYSRCKEYGINIDAYREVNYNG